MKILSDLTRDRLTLMGLGGLTIFAFFLNLGLNNIWTPNESFYAEAVREMLESGNYLELFYNYEPRFNKPPMLYWLIALSSWLFGLTEFAVRLPVALCGLGTIWLTYQIGRLLEGTKLGVVAAIVVAFSFQFVINARYAAPAVPLTFFFTLTLYFFLKGIRQNNRGYLYMGYLALGLTILTKGYPYFIIISLIAGLFLWFQSEGNWSAFWKKIKFTQLWIGLPVALLIGMSWIIYMYVEYGSSFYEVFMEETFRRAFTRSNSRLKPFFYLEANIWGFLPYSLTFYFGLIYLIFTRFKGFKSSLLLQFSLSWFLVMLVVFTIAKGKIPTYFIQGHPGMALFTAYFLIKNFDLKGWKKGLFQMQFWLPGIVFTLLGIAIIFVFGNHFYLYPVALLPLTFTLFNSKLNTEWLQLKYLPFSSLLFTYMLFGWLVLPAMEEGFRNQDEMGMAIQQQVPDQEIPVLMEDCLVHNLPYYAQRKVFPYLSKEEIKLFDQQSRVIIFTPAQHMDDYGPGFSVIWRGLHYTSSETRTLQFIVDMIKYKRGEPNRFEEYVLLYEQPKGKL